MEATVERERVRWLKRSAAKSRRRAAEKATRERKRRDVDVARRQRETEASGGRERAIDQRFRRSAALSSLTKTRPLLRRKLEDARG